jgi:hypothetical protein
MDRLNYLKAEHWESVVKALQNCTGLKEICDFEWSKDLLDPSRWDDASPSVALDSHSSESYVRKAGLLDLHSKGLRDGAAAKVLAGLLPRVSNYLEELNVR